MTYFSFHYRFNFSLLLVLLVLNFFYPCAIGEIIAGVVVIVAAFLFTTPWDNVAAQRKIWGFSERKYLFKIGFLPIEEYLFFVLQSLNVILGTRFFLHFFQLQTGLETRLQHQHFVLIAALLVGWIWLGVQLKQKPLERRFNYAAHLFFWFCPVIYLQWILAAPLLAAHLKLLFVSTFAFGIYYTLADLIAVRSNIWFFDETQITGIKFAEVLPWEEVAFFFLTSLLLAQSYLLLLPAVLR